MPLYVIVDEEWEGATRRILAYRHKPQGYEEVPLDERGRLLLEALGIRLGLRENHVVCYDAVTGDEVGDYDQVCQAWQAAEQRAETAEQGEREQTEARAAAEQREQEQTEARAAAEQRARTAEERLQELEAELRRLRGEDRA